MIMAILVVLLVALGVSLLLLWRRNIGLIETHSPIIDARGEMRRALEEAQRFRAEAMTELAEQKRQREVLSQEYASARALLLRYTQHGVWLRC